jgi:hypothetical protein
MMIVVKLKLLVSSQQKATIMHAFAAAGRRLNASTVGAERSQRRGGRWPSIGFAEEEGFDWVCCGGGDKTRGVVPNTTRKRYPRIEAEGCCILQRNNLWRLKSTTCNNL